jgi:hypothetical protein
MKFGLACEGITDHITIANILCGYFSNPDLDEEIAELQPSFDETEQKQGEGGWRMLLQYLTLARFREDVLNTEYVILQIDSDISEEFSVSSKDNDGNELPTEILIENIIATLVFNINSGKSGFYNSHANKIIFAISVHSLECWLVACHSEQIVTHNCFDILKTVINPNNIRVVKKRKNYDQLSQSFLNRDNINIVAKKSPSFNSFIQQLHNITL